MKKETVDGATHYIGIAEALTVQVGEIGMVGEWNVMIRPDGSLSLYATYPGLDAHVVVFDTLNNRPATSGVRQLLVELLPMKEAIQALERAVNESEEI